MPTLDKSSSEFTRSIAGQQGLAIIYADVLGLHQRAYGFVKRAGKSDDLTGLGDVLTFAGWKRLFPFFWNEFKPRRERTMESLSNYRDLLNNRASNSEFQSALQARKDWQGQLDREEAERADIQFKNVQRWLAKDSPLLEQDDELSELLGHCHERSCDWVFANRRIKSWIGQGPENGILWLKGKPGSGKSSYMPRVLRR
jgi:hypothetical protein